MVRLGTLSLGTPELLDRVGLRCCLGARLHLHLDLLIAFLTSHGLAQTEAEHQHAERAGKDSDAGMRHEFPAMIGELLDRGRNLVEIGYRAAHVLVEGLRVRLRLNVLENVTRLGLPDLSLL